MPLHVPIYDLTIMACYQTVSVDFDPDDSERPVVNSLKCSREEIPCSSHFPLKRSKAIIAPSANVTMGPSVRSAITRIGGGVPAPAKTPAVPLVLSKTKKLSATLTGKGKQPVRAIVPAEDK